MSLTITALVIFIIVLALWRRDIILYLFAGPVGVVAGLMLRPAYPTPDGLTVSLVLIGIGLYCFIKGIENVFRKTGE